MSVESLAIAMRTNQKQLGDFFGVTHVTIHYWWTGRHKPTGINLSLLNLATLIGRASGDVLCASLDLPLPDCPLDVVRRFFDGARGLHYYLDVRADEVAGWQSDPPIALRRYAALLDLTALLLPDLARQLKGGYLKVMVRNRRARELKATEQDKRGKAQRDRRAREREALIENDKIMGEFFGL